MPRRARLVIPGTAHHVVQRGNYQQYVFECDRDFRTYLYMFGKYADKYEVRVHAFCLMGNHVHFIVTPEDSIGLSKTFQQVHVRFSQYKNVQKQRLGHLWQGRFYSCVLGDTHLLRAIRYVEMNPVRARLVQQPWDYLWSSARQHLMIEKSPIVSTDFHSVCREIGLNHQNWSQYLLEEDMQMAKEMRKYTFRGLAIGEESFIVQLERKLGICLRLRKPGRPGK